MSDIQTTLLCCCCNDGIRVEVRSSCDADSAMSDSQRHSVRRSASLSLPLYHPKRRSQKSPDVFFLAPQCVTTHVSEWLMFWLFFDNSSRSIQTFSWLDSVVDVCVLHSLWQHSFLVLIFPPACRTGATAASARSYSPPDHTVRSGGLISSSLTTEWTPARP